MDWSDPQLNVLTARGTLGEVRREGEAFVAELRGLADLLSQESGRLYTARCGADLGDARCTVDLTSPTLRGTGAVSVVEGTQQGMTSGGKTRLNLHEQEIMVRHDHRVMGEIIARATEARDG